MIERCITRDCLTSSIKIYRTAAMRECAAGIREVTGNRETSGGGSKSSRGNSEITVHIDRGITSREGASGHVKVIRPYR